MPQMVPFHTSTNVPWPLPTATQLIVLHVTPTSSFAVELAGFGLGVPTVSLFGPGIAKKWAPEGDRHVVLNRHLACSPCTRFGYTPKCPIQAQCMTGISVDDVVAAAGKLLKLQAGLS